jgi:hypothetical protein
MIKQEAMKPGKLPHGFLASEFFLSISPGFLVSCSNSRSSDFGFRVL